MQQSRQTLVGLLRQASKVIKHEKMATEINTVAQALHLAADDQFAGMVDAGALEKFASEMVAGATLTKEQTPDGKGVNEGTVKDTPENTGAAITKEQTPNTAAALDTNMKAKSDGPVVKSASEVAGNWSDKASSLVLQKLASEAGRPDAVKEAELPKEQQPDGNMAGAGTVKNTPDNTGAAVTKEQQPDEASALKTNMVEKSHGAVDTKEASEEVVATEKVEEEVKEAAEEAPEEKEAAAEEAPEEKEAAAKEDEEKEASVKTASDSSEEADYTFSGVQMKSASSVEPVTLTDDDKDLAGLF